MIPFSWTVLGSGTHVPLPERGSPGHLLSYGGLRLLVDCGAGSLQRLARAGVEVRELDGVLLSHRHLDHVGELPSLLFTLRLLDPPRERELLLLGGEGLAAFVRALEAPFGHWVRPETFELRVVELPLHGPGTHRLPGGLLLESHPANHPEGALHLRFAAPDGRSAVYSGDTGPSEALEELARGSDLLVCECGRAEDDPWPHHLSAEDVAALVRVSRPRRVVLVHLYPWVDARRARERVAAEGVPVELARDGARYVLPQRDGAAAS